MGALGGQHRAERTLEISMSSRKGLGLFQRSIPTSASQLGVMKKTAVLEMQLLLTIIKQINVAYKLPNLTISMPPVHSKSQADRIGFRTA